MDNRFVAAALVKNKGSSWSHPGKRCYSDELFDCTLELIFIFRIIEFVVGRTFFPTIYVSSEQECWRTEKEKMAREASEKDLKNIFMNTPSILIWV